MTGRLSAAIIFGEYKMKKEVIKSPILSDKTAWIGVGLGLLFWFVESAIHSLVLHEGTFIRQLLSPAAHEAWMRGLIALMFITFGVYAQSIINRRNRADSEVETLKKQIEFILGAAKIGLDTIDSGFNVRYIDPEWEKVYGDPTGKKCYEYFMGRSEMCPGCGIPQALETKTITVTEEVLIKEGNRPIQVTTIPFQDENGEWLVAEVNVDISERKKAEEELRKHQDQLEKMVEERTTELTATNEELQQEIAERRQIEEELLRIKTNLEETNRRLKQNQAQLVQSEKMASIGQLAAGVAHEINNPVGFINSNLTTLDEYRRDLTTLINNYLELEQLADREPALSNNHDLAGALEAIRNSKEKMDIDFVLGDFDKIIAESKEGTDRIKKIVQDLKDFSHVDQAELKWANLNKGLESTLNIVWNEIKYKATVKKDYGDIPEVYCYPQQINQVVMNILVNAAHAIEDKGEIKISTAYIDGAEPMVEIRISDTGKGIPPENLPKIFDPFFTTKPVGKGTGLGLSMAYSIIKKHDGEIKVESEVGKGTTFVIELPVNGPRTKEGDTSDTG